MSKYDLVIVVGLNTLQEKEKHHVHPNSIE